MYDGEKNSVILFLQRRARGLQGGDASSEEAEGEGDAKERRREEGGQEEVTQRFCSHAPSGLFPKPNPNQTNRHGL